MPCQRPTTHPLLIGLIYCRRPALSSAPEDRQNSWARPREGQIDADLFGHAVSHLIRHLCVHVIACTTAWGFRYFPHDRNCPSTLDHRQAQQAVGVPYHGRIQGQIQDMVAPLGESLLYEWTIE
jgi:hypothetical protein